MEARKYSVENKTRASSISSGVAVVNATLEPLAILRVLVEGLAGNENTGIWLTNMAGIPMVPRISPFDLVYLDGDHRVVVGVQLLPSADFPPFKKPSFSALVLPLNTLASTKTKEGDELIFIEIEAESEDEPDRAALIEFTEAPAELVPVNGKIHPSEPYRAAAQLEEPADRPAESKFIATETGSEMDNSTRRAEPSSTVSNLISRFAIRPGRATEKSESTAREKEWMVNRFLRWLYPGAYETDRRKGRRVPIPDLVAYNLSTGVSRAFEVENISSSGIYLITEERWPAGSIVSLSIQREGPQETQIDHRLQFQAGAVRWGANGVGFEFVLPTGMDPRLWEGQTTKEGARRTSPEYVLREFKMARALAFIGRVSPPAQTESRRLLHEELSNVRAQYAVNVILKAEERLAQEIDGDKMLAHPDLLIAIVNGGSWADTEWFQDLWAGLLVTSCTRDGQDDSNQVFVNLLSQLATLQTRILTAVCAKAVTTVSSNGTVVSEKMFSTSEEMVKMAGSHDLLKVHRSVAQLAEFGLLEKSVRASFVAETEGATTTPTSLGLKMYARCLGRRDDI